jgi:hypothetical protein
MLIPNPKSILKPKVVFWTFLRMRGDKVAKNTIETPLWG